MSPVPKKGTIKKYLNYIQTPTILQKKTHLLLFPIFSFLIFFQQATLDHYLGDSLTHLMLITEFIHIQPKKLMGTS